ncbi:hypothetical protein HH214_00175 [Mucilaginibacter robiniae]|uniref:Uncharacterized protein n=1 Tax=Mucilaginibacter robiniae TaxID=2728022 RepID=A0A7L5DVZ6_9SPHI|nr:hypothetical protein [Mucilaginibacter robiniae]QJD94398.1 hypothetical protein HH214_00175 [Mucilaginibacter robiniae]
MNPVTTLINNENNIYQQNLKAEAMQNNKTMNMFNNAAAIAINADSDSKKEFYFNNEPSGEVKIIANGEETTFLQSGLILGVLIIFFAGFIAGAIIF